MKNKAGRFPTHIFDSVEFSNGTRIVTDEFNHRLLQQTDRAKWEEFGPETLNYPSGLAIFQDRLFVCDCWNHRIVMLDETGKITNQCGTFGQEPSFFDRPRDVCIFGEKVAVADYGNARIQYFDFDLRFDSLWDCKFATKPPFLGSHDPKKQPAYPSRLVSDSSVLIIQTQLGFVHLCNGEVQKMECIHPPYHFDLLMVNHGKSLWRHCADQIIWLEEDNSAFQLIDKDITHAWFDENRNLKGIDRLGKTVAIKMEAHHPPKVMPRRIFDYSVPQDALVETIQDFLSFICKSLEEASPESIIGSTVRHLVEVGPTISSFPKTILSRKGLELSFKLDEFLFQISRSLQTKSTSTDLKELLCQCNQVYSDTLAWSLSDDSPKHISFFWFIHFHLKWVIMSLESQLFKLRAFCTPPKVQREPLIGCLKNRADLLLSLIEDVSPFKERDSRTFQLYVEAEQNRLALEAHPSLPSTVHSGIAFYLIALNLLEKHDLESQLFFSFLNKFDGLDDINKTELVEYLSFIGRLEEAEELYLRIQSGAKVNKEKKPVCFYSRNLTLPIQAYLETAPIEVHQDLLKARSFCHSSDFKSAQETLQKMDPIHIPLFFLAFTQIATGKAQETFDLLSNCTLKRSDERFLLLFSCLRLGFHKEIEQRLAEWSHWIFNSFFRGILLRTRSRYPDAVKEFEKFNQAAPCWVTRFQLFLCKIGMNAAVPESIFSHFNISIPHQHNAFHEIFNRVGGPERIRGLLEVERNLHSEHFDAPNFLKYYQFLNHSFRMLQHLLEPYWMEVNQSH